MVVVRIKRGVVSSQSVGNPSLLLLILYKGIESPLI